MTGAAAGSLVWPDGSQVDDLVRRWAASFGGDPGDDRVAERWATRADAGEVAAWRVDGRIVAQSQALTTRRWIGGRLVGSFDLAAFSVAPADRGHGHARALVDALVGEGVRRGHALSLLFPATTGLYRGSGYEVAGDWAWFDVPATAVGVRAPGMRALRGDDWPAVEACFTAMARTMTGPAERDARRWSTLREARWGYVHDDRDGGLDAYLLVDHEPIADDWRVRVVVRDWAATSHEGIRAILGLVGREGTVGRDVRYRAPSTNPWLVELAEQSVTRTGGLQFMARPLDLAVAVSQRGWPRGVDVRVVLVVEDRVVGRWSTPHLLEVSDGEGRLSATDATPDCVADVRALGPLLLGHHDPATLVRSGLMAASPAAHDALTAACAGPVPTLLDFF